MTRTRTYDSLRHKIKVRTVSKSLQCTWRADYVRRIKAPCGSLRECARGLLIAAETK